MFWRSKINRTVFRQGRTAEIVVAALLFTSPALADGIGSAVSVVPSAQNQRGTEKIVLASGTELQQDDRISTSSGGSARLRFLDDTDLTVGPGADVLLDKFVFDGNKASSATISLTKGAFRFISGNSDKRVYQIKTPTATIGVRGTIVDLQVSNSRTIILSIDGNVDICRFGFASGDAGGCQTTSPGGKPLSVTKDGINPATDKEAAQLWRSLDNAHLDLNKAGGTDPTGGQQYAGLGNGTPGYGGGPSTETPSDSNRPDVQFDDPVPDLGPSPFGRTFTWQFGMVAPFAAELGIDDGGEGPDETVDLFNDIRTLNGADEDLAFDSDKVLRAIRGPTGAPGLALARIAAKSTVAGSQSGDKTKVSYQIGTFSDGSVDYLDTDNTAKRIILGPYQSLHYVLFDGGAAATAALSQIGDPDRKTDVVKYELASWTRPTWSDGHASWDTSPEGVKPTFGGEMALAFTPLGTRVGIDAHVDMRGIDDVPGTADGGQYSFRTLGGVDNPLLSSVEVGKVGTVRVNAGSSSTDSCLGNCSFGQVFIGFAGLSNATTSILTMNYDLAILAPEDQNLDEPFSRIQGAAVFTSVVPDPGSFLPTDAGKVAIAGYAQDATGAQAWRDYKYGGYGGEVDEDGPVPGTADVAIGTVDAFGQADSFRIATDKIVVRKGAAPFQTAKNADGLTVLAWSNWTSTQLKNGGTVTDSKPNGGGVHVIYGLPATDLPQNLMVDYERVVSDTTLARSADGTRTGTFSSEKLKVTFGLSEAQLDYDFKVVMTGDPTSGYRFSDSNVPVTAGNFSSTTVVKDATGTTPLANTLICPTSSCMADVNGFLAGKGASHIGVAYSLHGTGELTPQSAVSGTAAFEMQTQ